MITSYFYPLGLNGTDSDGRASIELLRLPGYGSMSCTTVVRKKHDGMRQALGSVP